MFPFTWNATPAQSCRQRGDTYLYQVLVHPFSEGLFLYTVAFICKTDKQISERTRIMWLACLLADTKQSTQQKQERANRTYHWAGKPCLTVQACLWVSARQSTFVAGRYAPIVNAMLCLQVYVSAYETMVRCLLADNEILQPKPTVWWHFEF